MFSKILIANRGEIACRVIATARRLGIATVAVYSAADRGARHAAEADEAYPIGPPPAAESYLDSSAILAAARASGAEAVHPGYGFLSENAEFAEACAAAGLVFIGPPPAAIRLMGSKAAAKALMTRHDVPVVPGYHGAEQDPQRLLAEARRIGFPVLIKASAGGGGRGMRIVAGAGEFAAALAAGRREAGTAFGDDRVLLEKYLSPSRHIEVQIFADRHGNAIQLGERDCSIQRRHQKVIEEAPAPGLDEARRRELGEWAVKAARAVGYESAGTVEFIAAENGLYFIEMNTRLQVEHPVTEAVTGLDLVEWQLRVAAGEALPLRQKEIATSGHAIEARLYAEDPASGFLPQTGILHRLKFPSPALARVDTGVREGDAVTAYYDPLVAKIIVAGADRSAAVDALRRALAETATLGVKTNLGFLLRIAAQADFAAGLVDTGFIERHAAALLAPRGPAPDPALAAAALLRLEARQRLAAKLGRGSEDRHSPWALADGWSPLGAIPQTLAFLDGAEERLVGAEPAAGGWRLRLGDREVIAAGARQADGALAVELDGAGRRLLVLEYGGEVLVRLDGEDWRLVETDPLAAAESDDPAAGRLTAPMPGRVIKVAVEPGGRVRRGEPLLILEAMKMEHTIAAPADGIVTAISCAEGDLVEEGAVLVALSPAAADDQPAEAGPGA
jgi:3-methylcrotonyl-CoA carboxylase alpha subunit